MFLNTLPLNLPFKNTMFFKFFGPKTYKTYRRRHICIKNLNIFYNKKWKNACFKAFPFYKIQSFELKKRNLNTPKTKNEIHFQMHNFSLSHFLQTLEELGLFILNTCTFWVFFLFKGFLIIYNQICIVCRVFIIFFLCVIFLSLFGLIYDFC